MGWDFQTNSGHLAEMYAREERYMISAAASSGTNFSRSLADLGHLSSVPRPMTSSTHQLLSSSSSHTLPVSYLKSRARGLCLARTSRVRAETARAAW